MRTAEYECEIGTTKHNARLHEAKAGGSHGAGDGVDLTFCRLWRNAHDRRNALPSARHTKRTRAERAADATSSSSATAAEPSFQLELSLQSSVRTRRAKYATRRRREQQNTKHKTKPSRAPKCALNW